MLELDKELNLILKISSDSANQTEVQKATKLLEHEAEELKKLGALQEVNSKRHAELLRQENALKSESIRLDKEAAALRSKAGADRAAGNIGAAAKGNAVASTLEAKSTEYKSRLGEVRKEISSALDWTNKLDAAEKKRLDSGVRAADRLAAAKARATKREQEEERRTSRTIESEMKKREKAQQKLVSSAFQAMNGVTSLAKSAALAYASVMNTDDKTVKQWMQWFTAIESVAQALGGIHSGYKAITATFKALQTLKKADIAINAALAVSEKAVCKAKDCGDSGGGGGIADKVKDGLWDKVKGYGKGLLANRYVRLGSRLALPAAVITAVTAASAAGYAGAADAFLGDGSRTAGALTSFAGMVGETFGEGSSGSLFEPYEKSYFSAKRASAIQQQQQAYKQIVSRNLNSPESIESRAGQVREGWDYLSSGVGRFASQYSDSALGNRQRLRAQRAVIGGAVLGAQELMTQGSRLSSQVGGREAGHKLMAQAYEQEARVIEEVINLKKQEQQVAMDAAREQLDFSRSLKGVFSAVSDSLRESRNAMTKGILTSSRGTSRRGFSALAKLEQDPEYELTYKEAEAMEATGLANTEKRRAAVEAARKREAIRRSPEAAAMYGAEAVAQVGLGMMGLGVAQAAPRAVADVKVAQDIVVKLERSQADELDNLIKAVQPKFEELLKKRNEELAKAVIAAVEDAARKAVLDPEAVQREIEANL